MSYAYLTSTADNASSPSRFKFNHHLDGLRGDFEVLVDELESLRKERDEYKARVEIQAKELQGVECNFVCERCREETTIAIANTSSSRLVSQPQSLDKPTTPGGSQNDIPSQHSHHSNHLIRRTPFAITQPSQTGFHTTPQTSDAPPSSHSPTSSVDSDPGSKDDAQSIDEFEKELDLDIAYVLSHGECIWCIKFSQDGKFLATGCKNGEAYIYDVQTGTLTCVLRNLLAEHDSIRAVCFSPDGKYLATSSSDAYIYIWEIRTKRVRNAFKSHTDLICSLDFSPNGQFLVSASYDNSVRLWNMRQSVCKVLTDEDHSFLNYDYYKSAKFCPDGKCVAASHCDGAVRIWDVRLGQLMKRVRAHVDLVNDIAFVPDGKGLITGGRDMTLKYWDVGSLDGWIWGVEELTRPEREFSGHEDSVYSVAISPDGRWVASGSDDQSVRIWDINTAKVECILDCITNDDNGEVNLVDFNPAGRYFAVGGDDGTVRIWRYSLEIP